MNCISGWHSAGEQNISRLIMERMHDIDYLYNTEKEFYLGTKIGLTCCHPRGGNPARRFQLSSIEGGALNIVFGGQIYNRSALWQRLKKEGDLAINGPDSVLILYLYRECGDDFLHYLNGKFAFVIWDVPQDRLLSARDRFGIELLYYYKDAENVVFSSRIQPLLKSGLVSPQPNIDRIHNFLEYSYTGGDQTFFRNIYELPMGHLLITEKGRHMLVKWYDITEHVANLGTTKETDMGERFEEIMTDAIKIRIDDTRKVGMGLSGGPDSSYIVCLANKLNQQKLPHASLESFSLRFDDPSLDEGHYINSVLERINIPHHNIFLDGTSLFEELNKIIEHFEEPFHKIHTFMYWKLAEELNKNGVAIMIFGQGAESIIGGQSDRDYILLIIELLKSGRLVQFIQEIKAVSMVREISKLKVCERLLLLISPLARALFEKLTRRYRSVASRELVRRRIRKFSTPRRFANKLTQSIFEDLYSQPYEFREFSKHEFDIDCRFPFMDHRLVEFAYSLPDNLKINHGISKIVLRKGDILPELIRQRTDKMMSADIMENWFRTLLKDKVTNMINSDSFESRGLFDVAKIKNKVEAHNRGEINIGKEIARWISLELWLRRFIDGRV